MKRTGTLALTTLLACAPPTPTKWQSIDLGMQPSGGQLSLKSYTAPATPERNKTYAIRCAVTSIDNSPVAVYARDKSLAECPDLSRRESQSPVKPLTDNHATAIFYFYSDADTAKVVRLFFP